MSQESPEGVGTASTRWIRWSLLRGSSARSPGLGPRDKCLTLLASLRCDDEVLLRSTSPVSLLSIRSESSRVGPEGPNGTRQDTAVLGLHDLRDLTSDRARRRGGHGNGLSAAGTTCSSVEGSMVVPTSRFCRMGSVPPRPPSTVRYTWKSSPTQSSPVSASGFRTRSKRFLRQGEQLSWGGGHSSGTADDIVHPVRLAWRGDSHFRTYESRTCPPLRQRATI